MAKVRCSSCGAVFEVFADEPTMKCPGCGRKYRNPKYVAPENINIKVAEKRSVEERDEVASRAADGESKFVGTAGKLLGLEITNFLLVLVTLTIFTPWALCRRYRWRINNKIIDGKRLSFDGTGGELVGNYYWWMFLCAITLGIYGIWVPKKLQEWLNRHTYIEGERRDLNEFEGSVGQRLRTSIVSGLLEFVTLGFYAAWGKCKFMRWQINNSVIAGRKMRFDGTGGELLGKWALYGLLNIITLGIYSVFSYVKMQQWITENIHFEN